MKKILVIGSLNMDIVLNVDNMPLTGETIIGGGLRYSPGGKGANQACAVGRLGGMSAMLGRVGDDNFGTVLVDNLSSSGVDMALISRMDGQSTGTAVIFVDKRGDNSIVVIPGANSSCDTDYLKSMDCAFQWCDYVLLQLEIPLEAACYAICRAYELGRTIILNPAPAPMPSDIPESVLKKLDIITPNETELAKLTGMDCGDIDAIKAAALVLAEKIDGIVVVTAGSYGAILAKDGVCTSFPSIKVDAVDTTAAGDCFNGALVVGLSEGKAIEQCIAFANIAAGITVTRQGAQDSIPSRAEVDALALDIVM